MRAITNTLGFADSEFRFLRVEADDDISICYINVGGLDQCKMELLLLLMTRLGIDVLMIGDTRITNRNDAAKHFATMAKDVLGAGRNVS